MRKLTLPSFNHIADINSHSSVPSSYIHSLECFISAKQEFLAQGNSSSSHNLATIYDYQQKYVSALLRQLPPGTVFPATSRPVPIHSPTLIKSLPVRQGPFLLQPEPRVLEGSEGGDATDIAYLVFGADDEDDSEREGNPTEHLGIVTVAYQDGRLDLFLDVEKVEARWDVKGVSCL
jgi:nucleoporin NUP82